MDHTAIYILKSDSYRILSSIVVKIQMKSMILLRVIWTPVSLSRLVFRAGCEFRLNRSVPDHCILSTLQKHSFVEYLFRSADLVSFLCLDAKNTAMTPDCDNCV